MKKLLHPAPFPFILPALALASTIHLANLLGAEPSLAQDTSLCPVPALARITSHQIAPGETVDSIAQQYNLISATLLGFNPSLRNGSVPVGTEILIPPYNGIQVTVPSGSSWQEVAAAYNVRADVLFEVNGCQTNPEVVFVPGVNWSPNQAPTTAAASGSTAAPVTNPITGYPLPAVAPVLTTYGWQLDPDTNAVVFQSGVDLQADRGTSVLAVGAGTVAFAGAEGTYGNLVVINHAQGFQTRYAQLDQISVQVGQQVQTGDSIGTVGSVETLSYLHFEVRTNSDLGWVAQDPSDYVPDIQTADSIR